MHRDLPPFGDRFVPIRMLGEGAFGLVYEVFDRMTGDLVALKTLRLGGAAEVESLKHEFHVLSRLRHRNLVRLYELFIGDTGFFTMERIEGVDLLSWVRAGREAAPFTEGRLREGLRQIAQGLHALHVMGFAHGDIKPQNVLVDGGGDLNCASSPRGAARPAARGAPRSR